MPRQKIRGGRDQPAGKHDRTNLSHKFHGGFLPVGETSLWALGHITRGDGGVLFSLSPLRYHNDGRDESKEDNRYVRMRDKSCEDGVCEAFLWYSVPGMRPKGFSL